MKSGFTPRIELAVVALNSFEIAILGGHNGKTCLRSIYLFNTRSFECKKINQNESHMFSAPGNQTVLVTDNEVAVAAICKDRMPSRIIKFSKGGDP